MRPAYIPGMSNPTRVSSGVPTGGQFTRNDHSESPVTLDEAAEPAVSRFATNGSQRSTPVPKYMEGARTYASELRQAMAYMRDFSKDDVVVVTGEQGHEHFAKITRDRLSDGDYGSAESRTLSASLGTNKYTHDVTSHKLAMGQVGMRHIRPDEQAAADAQFADAEAAWAVPKAERLFEGQHPAGGRQPAAVGEQAVAWEGTSSEVRGTVHTMTDRGSVALIIEGRVGAGSVPAGAISPKTPAVELR